MFLLAHLVIVSLVFIAAQTNPSLAQEFPSAQQILPEEGVRIDEVWETPGAVLVNGHFGQSKSTTLPGFIIICDRRNPDNALLVIQNFMEMTGDRMIVAANFCDDFQRVAHERAKAQGVEVKRGFPLSIPLKRRP